MHKKWFLPFFITLLAIAGIGLEQFTVPNQQIVVQFADVDVSSLERQDAMLRVKTQLEDAGADKIRVQETTDGNLRISYYSDVDIASIRLLFSSETSVALQYGYVAETDLPSGIPAEKGPDVYELGFYEIQNHSDFQSDLEGHLIEFETKSTRFFTPDVYFYSLGKETKHTNEAEAIAYRFGQAVSLSIANPSYVIPEVRAGPNT